MFRKVLRSKIHRATITKTDLDYEGSITLPGVLMQAAQISEFEAVSVWNITNGSRLETYAILNPDASDHQTICMNGAGAHLMHPGDLVIIASFNYLENAEVSKFKPRIVFVDQNNQIQESCVEISYPIGE